MSFPSNKNTISDHFDDNDEERDRRLMPPPIVPLIPSRFTHGVTKVLHRHDIHDDVDGNGSSGGTQVQLELSLPIDMTGQWLKRKVESYRTNQNSNGHDYDYGARHDDRKDVHNTVSYQDQSPNITFPTVVSNKDNQQLETNEMKKNHHREHHRQHQHQSSASTLVDVVVDENRRRGVGVGIVYQPKRMKIIPSIPTTISTINYVDDQTSSLTSLEQSSAGNHHGRHSGRREHQQQLSRLSECNSNNKNGDDDRTRPLMVRDDRQKYSIDHSDLKEEERQEFGLDDEYPNHIHRRESSFVGRHKGHHQDSCHPSINEGPRKLTPDDVDDDDNNQNWSADKNQQDDDDCDDIKRLSSFSSSCRNETSIMATLRGCNNSHDDGDGIDEKTTAVQSRDGPHLVSTRFSDIIGHKVVKERLNEVLLPLALPPELIQTVLTGIRSFSPSVLMFGPPGCGKTKLARALAGEAGAAFLSVGPSDVLSKYVGESEASIRNLFVKAAKMAREMDSKCAVLFFDEIDALGQSRGGGGGTPLTGDPTHTNQMSCAGGGGADGSSRRVLAELLIQMTRLNTSNGMIVDETSAADKADTSGPYMEVDGTDVDDLSEGDVHLADDQKHLDGDDNISSETMDNTSEFAATNEIDNNEEQQESSKGNTPVRVIVVAATNRPEDCDPALIRRFAIQVRVGLPTEKDRRRILKHLFHGIDHSITRSEFTKISREMGDWTGSDLEKVVREAAMAPIRECIKSATKATRSRDATSKQTLLRSFQNLRPVDVQDLEKAIHFVAPKAWLDNEDDSTDGYSSDDNSRNHSEEE